MGCIVNAGIKASSPLGIDLNPEDTDKTLGDVALNNKTNMEKTDQTIFRKIGANKGNLPVGSTDLTYDSYKDEMVNYPQTNYSKSPMKNVEVDHEHINHIEFVYPKDNLKNENASNFTKDSSYDSSSSSSDELNSEKDDNRSTTSDELDLEKNKNAFDSFDPSPISGVSSLEKVCYKPTQASSDDSSIQSTNTEKNSQITISNEYQTVDTCCNNSDINATEQLIDNVTNILFEGSGALDILSLNSKIFTNTNNVASTHGGYLDQNTDLKNYDQESSQINKDIKSSKESNLNAASQNYIAKSDYISNVDAPNNLKKSDQLSSNSIGINADLNTKSEIRQNIVSHSSCDQNFTKNQDSSFDSMVNIKDILNNSDKQASKSTHDILLLNKSEKIYDEFELKESRI